MNSYTHVMDRKNLISWLKDTYEFNDEISVELLRSYTNHVYLVKTNDKKFVLKIYGENWRSGEEILWEIDLINHLIKKGVNVAGVISGKDGRTLEIFNDQDKTFSAVLFEYAKGSKSTPPFTQELRYKLGKSAAMLHKASDDFKSKYSRPSVDLKYLIDDSILIAERLLDEKDFNSYKNFGLSLKDRINIFIQKGLDWGVVHGDLTLDNIHFTDDGEIIFYDFDSSGFGFRAMELFGWGVLDPKQRSGMEAYLKGYQKVRKIDPINIKASPYLQAALDFWLKEGMKAIYDKEVLHQQLSRVWEWKKYFSPPVE